MTNGEKMLVSIAIEAAKSCLHVFENEYPADGRPRKALEAAEVASRANHREPPASRKAGDANLEIKGVARASWICRASVWMRGQGCPTSRYLGNGCNLV